MATSPRKGFNPSRQAGSAPDNKGLTQYKIANGYATALAAGDPVKLVAGFVVQATNGAECLGVFHSCQYVDAQNRLQYQKYWPAGQLSPQQQPTCLIMDAPHALYKGKADGSIAGVLVGDIYPVTITAPDANIGHSTMVIHTTPTRTGSLAIVGTNNAALTNLENADVFTVKSSMANVLGTITIVTNQTPAQLLALINAVPGVHAALNASNFLTLTTTDGGSLVLADSTGTPLADSSTFIGAVGTIASPVAVTAGMVRVTDIIDLEHLELEVSLIDEEELEDAAILVLAEAYTDAEISALDIFKTIVVAGQSSVVADNDADTLTLVAGAGITITTNAGTDTITFAAGGGGGAAGPYIDLTGVASVIAGTIAANTVAGNNRYILSADAGTNIALPIPTGAGTVLEFVVKTKSLTNGYVIHITTDSGSNHFTSSLLGHATIASSAVTNVSATVAGNHNVITLLNGTAGTGGDVGDVIIFTDAIAGFYQVTGVITVDTATNTFSAVG